MQPLRAHAVSGILGLASSSLRHDWLRHLAGASTVALLMATFVGFNALAAGLDQGLSDALVEQRMNDFTTPKNVLVPMEEVRALAEIPGAVEVIPKGIARTGIRAGGFNEVLLVGVDATAEAPLVREAREEDEQAPSPFTLFDDPGPEYVLRAGRWLAGPGEAVLDDALGDASALGRTIELNVSGERRAFEVVGVIATRSPANLGMPGAVEGVAVSGGTPIVSGPHVVLRIEDFPFSSFTSVRVVAEPRDEALRSVAGALIEEHPEGAHVVQDQMARYDRLHYDSVEAIRVLGAVERLTGLVGTGTMFGVSLLLLTREERHLGLLRALGFSSRHVWLHAAAKTTALVAAGIAAGLLVAALALFLVPLPEVGFDVPLEIDARAALAASLGTAAFAATGALVALLTVLLKPPAAALRYAE